MIADLLKTQEFKNLMIVDYGYTEESIPRTYGHFKEWLDHDNDLPLSYLRGERGQIRQDLKNFFPEFESALVFIFSYVPTKRALNALYQVHDFKLAAFSLAFGGEDYHYFIERALGNIAKRLQEYIPDLKTKNAVDVHPVLDRDLAYRAGLGFFGKNSMLINENAGSYCIVGSLLLSKKLDLPVKGIVENKCGECCKCVEQCLSGAIIPQKNNIKINKCLSYFSIESKRDADHHAIMDSRCQIFGCDNCMDVCPINQKIVAQSTYIDPLTAPLQKLLIDFFIKDGRTNTIQRLKSMSNRQFAKMFDGTSLSRIGREKLLNNIRQFCYLE